MIERSDTKKGRPFASIRQSDIMEELVVGGLGVAICRIGQTL